MLAWRTHVLRLHETNPNEPKAVGRFVDLKAPSNLLKSANRRAMGSEPYRFLINPYHIDMSMGSFKPQKRQLETVQDTELTCSMRP